MTPPRLEACYFADSHPLWRRLAAVLETSVRLYCPDWQVRIAEITPAPETSPIGRQSHAVNTQKLDQWAAAVAEAADGDRVLLIDADTVILRPLEDVWAFDFDFAYTTKRARFPFNGGVVFLRISEPVKAFVEAWRCLNREFFGQRLPTPRWQARYGGVNQGSLAALLTENSHGLRIRELPCAEWNCEDASWSAYDPDITRIVHIKGALRKAIFQTLHSRRPEPMLAPLVDRWRALEAQVLARSA